MSSEAIAASGSVAPQQASQDRVAATQESPVAQKLAEAREIERVQKAQETAEVQQEPTLEQLEVAVGQINDLMKEGQRALAFNLDRDSGQVIVKVTNTQTDELIRQIPNEDALQFAKNIESMMGLIFNDKA